MDRLQYFELQPWQQTVRSAETGEGEETRSPQRESTKKKTRANFIGVAPGEKRLPFYYSRLFLQYVISRPIEAERPGQRALDGLLVWGHADDVDGRGRRAA